MTPIEILTVTIGTESARGKPRRALRVIRADTAYVMTNMLRGVVQRGTAAAAAALKWPLGGKTGTVDDNTDAWFVGFDPNITVGVRVGLDEKKSLGSNETGAVAALPIWMEFMKAYIGGRPDKDDPPDFETPGNIVFLPVDRTSGVVTDSGVAGAIPEASFRHRARRLRSLIPGRLPGRSEISH